jgi:hypothetical protein
MLGPPALVGDTIARTPLAASPARNVVPHPDCIDEAGQAFSLDQLFDDRFSDAAADAGAVEL